MGALRAEAALRFGADSPGRDHRRLPSSDTGRGHGSHRAPFVFGGDRPQNTLRCGQPRKAKTLSLDREGEVCGGAAALPASARAQGARRASSRRRLSALARAPRAPVAYLRQSHRLPGHPAAATKKRTCEARASLRTSGRGRAGGTGPIAATRARTPAHHHAHASSGAPALRIPGSWQPPAR
jgi:hypothetical protein